MKTIFSALLCNLFVLSTAFAASGSKDLGPLNGGGSAGAGTVTSVDLTVPTFLSVTGNPVTTSGTLAVALSGTALPLANGGTGTTTGLPLNNIIAATAGVTIDNLNFAHVWNWSTITSATALKITSASVGFTGKMLQLENTTSNAGVTGTALDINLSGTSGGPVALNIVNAGAASTGRAINIDLQGTGGARTAVAIAHAGTNNSAIGESINMSAATGASSALSITGASATNAAKGIGVTMSGSSGDTQGINISVASATSEAIHINRASTGGTGWLIDATENSTSGGIMYYGRSTGASGNNTVYYAQTDSNGAPWAAQFKNSGTTNTGMVLQATNSSTAGGWILVGDTSMANIAQGIALRNQVTAANGSGNSIQFTANQTGTLNKAVAEIDGLITDITTASADGALDFLTAFNNTLAARIRLDNAGHWVYQTASTAPTITANCGTSPSVAGKDGAGRVTVGSGGTDVACTLTFGNAWATAPSCQCNDESTALLLKCAASTTTLVVTSATPFGAADKITYLCEGY